MPQIRQFPWPEFLAEPSDEQIAPQQSQSFAERVEALLGPVLDGMSELQLNKLDLALDKRLRQAQGNHSQISDLEIQGLAEAVQATFPLAFQIAGENLRRRKEGMN